MNQRIFHVFVTFLIGSTFVDAGLFYKESECNWPLLDRAVFKATSSMKDRGPENARLYGLNAWTASNNDFDQQLIIDLGQIMNVTRIWTQGRARSNEYVMEYAVSYGTNGLDYAWYKEPGGNTKMFKGNTNGDTVRKNEFEVPIIAQWIRINPTRWRDRISMRVEFFGCDYIANDVYFNGTSLVSVDLSRDRTASWQESIKFRFKTNVANGVVMYSRGTQGDYFALQLRDNRMVLNLNLGSNEMTSLSVGSLLDNNLWHDVVISRNKRDIIFSVDRVMIQGRIKGEFERLDLDRKFYIGGVPNPQEGLVVYQNYTGCLENLYINSTNIIVNLKQAYENGETYQYEKFNTKYTCPEPPIIPVTFLTSGSYARLRGYEGVATLNVTFGFRTYEQTGILVFHEFSSGGYIKLFLEDGRVKIDIETPDTPRVILDNYDTEFNDGMWHNVILSLQPNLMILDIDRQPMRTVRILKVVTGSVYYIGGRKASGTSQRGFIGCMRMITIDGNYKLPTDWKDDDYCCQDEVVFDSCRMTDKCNPNPCQHGGVCRQSWLEFFCNCSDTGYGGAVCHTSLNPLSCEALQNVQSVGQTAEAMIDVDGSGPLKPFPVTCEYFSGVIQTVLKHSNDKTTTVDNYQEPGSFVQDIEYDADYDQIEALMNRSVACKQRITYRCRNSKLMNSPSDRNNFSPFAWWVSRHNQRMDYWGGAVPGSRKCECGITGKCVDPKKWCNCDAGFDTWLEDDGVITEKDSLPVKQLHFGDTGNSADNKMGLYTLGSLTCEGDDLFNSIVTFRVVDATINLPTFDMGHSGDIYFEFKTTVENAVIFHSKGPTDSIKLSILGGDQLQFVYQAGTGPLSVTVETSYKLANNKWHTVSVERNRKAARLVVDGALHAEVREPPGPVRALYLTSPFVLGASVDYRDGFVGCIRSLLLNGVPIDLKHYARAGIYGIVDGCVGNCGSNPCLNNGTCLERYDGYSCDCRWTSFKGPICGDEIGVNLQQHTMIKYDFLGSWRSTIAEHIRVGFTTTNPKGFLLGFSSNITGEYLTIMVSNSGHLRCVFDFGFERQEIIFPNKHFGLGQYHDVLFQRKESGSVVVLKVDNYQPVEYRFDIKASADAQFNNIQYMYIGKNESMREGFVGCVSRVEFDDIYPLKFFFQQDKPPNVYSATTLTEDFCGVEPITHPPMVVETRPPPIVDQRKLREAYNEPNSALIGGVVFFLFLLIILLAILGGRYLAQHKGEYLTQEDAGAHNAFDPDSAVVQSHTGHHVEKRREFFI